MAILYESFFDPFVIMFSVPTAFIGVVLHCCSPNHLSVPGFIGVIMLVGIVVANAIVFVDYLKQMREEGMGAKKLFWKPGGCACGPSDDRPGNHSGHAAYSPGAGRGGEAIQPLGIVVWRSAGFTW